MGTANQRQPTKAELDAIGTAVLRCTFAVHTVLGPGLLEKAYSSCFARELELSGIAMRREVPIPICWKGQQVDEVGYRMDFLIADTVVVELKASEAIHPLHEAQLVSYLKLSGRRLGYLINFNVESLRDGIRRRVNGL